MMSCIKQKSKCIVTALYSITLNKFAPFRPYYSQKKNPKDVAMFVIDGQDTSRWLCIFMKSGYSNRREVWADDALSLLPQYHSRKSRYRSVLLLELLLWVQRTETGNPVFPYCGGWLPDRGRTYYPVKIGGNGYGYECKKTAPYDEIGREKSGAILGTVNGALTEVKSGDKKKNLLPDNRCQILFLLLYTFFQSMKKMKAAGKCKKQKQCCNWKSGQTENRNNICRWCRKDRLWCVNTCNMRKQHQ